MRKINKLDFIGPNFKLKLKEAMKNLDESIETLFEVATKDEKTGLYNNLFFRNIFSLELENARRKKPLSLIIVDIDHFKKINDTYGHLVGDKTLKSLAKLLQKQVRKNDIVARFGGEEFFIMLPNTNIERAKQIAERLRKATEKSNSKPSITISLGVTEYKQGDNLRKMTLRADEALYYSKEHGRNQVRVN
jgi:diguanylate cyclase (GGDEF)-like protein